MIARLAKGSPVSGQTVHGDTALHLAAMNGQTDRVAALLRSPFCGVSEQGLYDLAHGRDG